MYRRLFCMTISETSGTISTEYSEAAHQCIMPYLAAQPWAARLVTFCSGGCHGMGDDYQLYELIIEKCLSLIPHWELELAGGVYSAEALSEDNVNFARQGRVEANEGFA
ncbi:hypothetical protein BTVI_157351 [Pitangus sulphuratus]|nr:hypothetical protein BTVI_157351 [Pitangus sulphuratus]